MVALELLSLLLVALKPVSALWPEPSSVTTGTTTLFIDKSIEVTYNGERVGPSPHSHAIYEL
jgi:hexosaminidase